MAQAASITLNDAQVTPVAHVFTPAGFDDKRVYWWEEFGVASASIGNYRISATLTRAPNPGPGSSASDRVNRVKLALHLPVLEVVGTNDQGYEAPPKVSFVLRATDGGFILPDRASEQNRKDLRKMYYELLNNSQVIDMITKLIQPT